MKKNGLSIPEVMIAIFIVLIGLSIISGVISKTILLPGFSSLYFEASYLVQEGIELVRNARDENLLQNLDWKTNLLRSVPPAPAPFTRTVTVREPIGAPPDTTVLITATVTFSFKGIPYNFSAQEYIYRWIR